MKERLKEIVEKFHKYNSEHMAAQSFGFSEDIVYDALVVAPSFTPYKLKMDERCKVTTLAERSYIAGYLLEKDDIKIAWIKIAASAGNIIDHLSLCAELSFKQLIFLGAVGALKDGFSLGEICTPSYCISGSQADAYLTKDSVRDSMLHEKVFPDEKYVDEVIEIAKNTGHEIRKGSVFCTPTIAMEYMHLDEIRSYGTDLIEMATATFYLMADLFELPAVALLVVSDNSATGAALVGRTDEEQEQYEYGRDVVLPDMVFALAECQR